MPTSVCTAKASYKKLAGVLELTDSHLQWTQDSKKSPSVRVTRSEASALFCSKEGSAQVRLKLALVNDDVGHNFTFTSPQAAAEREKFKKELTDIISRNRTTQVIPNQTVIPSGIAPVKHASARPMSSVSTAETSRAASVASDGRTPVLAGSDAATEFRLRKKVLMNNPELRTLHRELVMTDQITEAEFWDGREHLLVAQVTSENQKRGKPGQIVDPRPETVDGETKIKITPQLVHDIFDEYPVVAKAYNDNVPNKLSEAEFWKRYFQSKLFNAHRASIRSTATQHVVKDDPIFDKYLEKDDDDLEPRRQRGDEFNMLVNLVATLEDHGETGNEKDVTMQAGRQRGALPLIRKFNEHSERLLNSALGEGPSKRRRTDGGEVSSYAEIDLDDLHDPESTDGIFLDMKDRQRYFESRSQSSSEAKKTVDVRTIFREARKAADDWTENLAQFKQEKEPANAAVISMTQNVSARLDVRSRKNDIPENLFRQLTTCQTAANEFLRQFWASMYPPSAELQTLTVATPTQKAAKAAKMIGYLSKTHEKVDALIKTAQREGLDPNRIQMVMKPLLDAVDHALHSYRSKKPSRV